MRAALWFLGLFGVAVAIALFAGNNQGTVTLFWPPYRVDLSVNLVLLLLALLFVVLHLALRALAALFALPGLAKRWRIQHQERMIHLALLDALAHLIAGRFVRARKAAETVLGRDAAMKSSGETLAYSARLRTLAHLLAAESAQALRDKAAREIHLAQALEQTARRDGQEIRDGVQLRAAHWALQDHDAAGALHLLDELAQGTARRTLALRLRLRAARAARQPLQALETARLLAKHRAFSELAARGLLRALALELVATAHDGDQMKKVWQQLDASERETPEVAMAACRRMLQLSADADLALSWLQPVWERMRSAPGAGLTEVQRVNLVQLLESGFKLATADTQNPWLTRIEQAQMADPGDPVLQYLAGSMCLRLQLWGKAQQLIRQALPRLQDATLERSAWAALAELAQQRGDADGAAQAWKSGAQVAER
jgi:HemY protein